MGVVQLGMLERYNENTFSSTVKYNRFGLLTPSNLHIYLTQSDEYHWHLLYFSLSKRILGDEITGHPKLYQFRVSF